MSERADLDRTMRRLWATSGSSHDRVVRILDWPALQARAEFDPTYLHLTREPR